MQCTSPFTLSLSVTLAQLHPCVHLGSFELLILTLLYHPLRSLFIICLLFISSLSFSFLFTSLFHSALYSLCCLHPYLFWTVSAVLQGSVQQLTKRTVRSVIITVLHSFTPCLHTPSCRLPALSTLQEIVSWERNKKKHRYESYLWVSKT